jgi:hypothetical protein
MEISLFIEKENMPNEEALRNYLGEKINWWKEGEFR